MLTLPALYKSPAGVPTAFYAVVSVAVIGLYLAFMIPIYLRLRAGDNFKPGPWTLGSKYKVLGWIAVDRDHRHLDLLHPAVRAQRDPVQQRLQLDCR